MTTIVAVENLSKRYGSVDACQDISFVTEAGQCVGLLGPNGAGKTSLLSCMVGIKLPSDGTVRIDGQPPTHLVGGGALLGYVFDPPSLTTDFTGEGCLVWEALAQGLSRETAREAVRQYGISDYAHRRVGKMSTGQRQRVAIAAALVGDPDVLILDEPTNGLDIEATRWLRELIVDRTREGKTTIVSSHQLGEIRRVVDRVVVVNKTLRYDGPTPEGSAEEMESWYLNMAGREQETIG
ncbi:ABC transporter ATP-binding protein [Nesterenkonia halobia]|uniref:ABC transporter domain-containing protein n=1 Tax=Nesterenkonia halobia TaxID=37922 RepID=A0ABP6REJ7_9MICC